MDTRTHRPSLPLHGVKDRWGRATLNMQTIITNYAVNKEAETPSAVRAQSKGDGPGDRSQGRGL